MRRISRGNACPGRARAAQTRADGAARKHDTGAPHNEPAEACVIDKIEQFRAILADPKAHAHTRLRALQFLLHLVGDVHQPLHASDNGDAGGNGRRVSLKGLRTGSLHHYWDTELVERLARLPTARGASRGAREPVDARQSPMNWLRGSATRISSMWSIDDPETWAWEAYRIAKADAYGRLRKPDRKGIHRLTQNYAEHASPAIALQLSRAGIRLAGLLNASLEKDRPQMCVLVGHGCRG